MKTLELKEFFDDNVPRYAILSHTWGQEEVSFQDLCWLNDYENKRLEPTSLPALISRTHKRRKEKATAIFRRSGFEKIVQSARLAEQKRLRYLWVDTCCIDKSSSSELSEAINSMFRWYKESAVCFAFLSDVRSRARTRCLFGNSRWFTRGWTLQELIAPREVLFYDKHWNFTGSRSSLSIKIQDITGIPIKELETKLLHRFAPAVRLGWARKRNTSRKEDIAYCLMDIFGITMPLLYGEGGKAFVRLQQEIIKEHRGQSLLAGGYNESPLIRSTFAPSPSYFGNLDMTDYPGEAFHLNNRGLEISLRIFQLPNIGVGSISDRYDVHYAVWEVNVYPRLGFKNFSTHRLCFPLLASSTGSKGTNDEQEMIQLPSRPVVINAGHVPRGTAHRKVLILGPKILDFFRNNFLRVRIRLTGLYKFLPSARLVEVFPPAANIGFESIPGAFATLSLSVGANRNYGTHIFRFLVPGNIRSTNVEGDRSMHFAVILGPYSAAAATETTLGKPGPEVIVSAIEWMDHSKSPERKSDKLQEEAKRFWSLVDAFMAGVPLLDAKIWFDKQVPFFVGGRPLLAATTLKSGVFLNKDRPEITEVGFSLGKGKNQVDTR